VKIADLHDNLDLMRLKSADPQGFDAGLRVGESLDKDTIAVGAGHYERVSLRWRLLHSSRATRRLVARATSSTSRVADRALQRPGED
jgi:hypothetical protein